MQRHCAICAEPLLEPARATAGLCLICAHRTTLAERIQRRPIVIVAGVLDNA